MRTILSLLLLFCLYSHSKAINRYPAEVNKVLEKAGSNRVELEKAIVYFQRSGDVQKLQAIYFLIANMDIHYGCDYYWAGKNGQKVNFNEFNYGDTLSARKALNKLGAKVHGLHPVSINVPDINNIKSGYLITNVNLAFRQWRSGASKTISFNDFCEYILPYRISVEPLQDWRAQFESKYKWLDVYKEQNLHAVLYALATNTATWFSSIYGYQHDEPLPRLGPQNILFRRRGFCEDFADLQVFALRSKGLPCTVDIVPYWGTSTGSHFANTLFNEKMKPIPFDVGREVPLVDKTLSREPGKVVQLTYSKQKGLLADILPIKAIPEGFMQTRNYIDVTDQYWPAADVSCKLYDSNRAKIGYSCVLNGLKWRPTWWGKVNGGSITFSKLAKGVVYLPVYYIDNKIVPAGYPVAQGYHHQAVLIPQFDKKIQINIKREINYVGYQPGKRYRLYYWNKKWIPAGEKIAGPDINSMQFAGIPANCLYILIPEYSQKKERPFIVTEDGTINWF